MTPVPPEEDARVKCVEPSFPIVGIGASAGGFKAMHTLLEAMPDEPGLAVVVIQHLDPTKKSLAPELLAKYTRLQVAQVSDDARVKPNCVYVIPPNKYLSIAGGELHLSEPDRPRGSRMAIDYFLRSLAEDQGHCAVGVILSGSGTDGTLGIKAIKAVGGLVIAQDPTTAEFEGMPRSAIDTSVVDHILPPEQIPEVLVWYAQHPYVRESNVIAPAEEQGQPDVAPVSDGFEAIVSVLRAHTRHDFHSYKETTLVRRTRRRMCLHHIDDYDTYLAYLRAHPDEIDLLAKDLLITVTDFFREPQAWEELQRLAIEPLVKEKSNDDPIRVWTPGCATGEEPYSVAMLILEELRRAEKSCALNVFASDIDKGAIDYARVGRYPKSIQADLSPERLSRFFTAADGDNYYHVNKTLREAVVFAEQNLIADPPFSKLDMICCRNLLIYLKLDVQDKVIALFHFALSEGGVLFLGSAESIGRQTDLFKTLSKRWRIFRRIGPTHHDRVDIPLATGHHRRDVEPPMPQAQRHVTRLTHVAQQRLLDLLSPSAVLIDRDWRVLYICGDVDNYLTRKAGVPTDNLLENARRGLRTKLRGAVHSARTERGTVVARARVHTPSGYAPVSLTVRAIHDREQGEDLALVVFEEAQVEGSRREGKAAAAPREPSGGSLEDGTVWEGPLSTPDATDIDEDAVVRQLETELADVKEDLQSSVEQLEASNEELKASNEEVMSINEELQSTNEELETSKEELQSLNEELSTVNNQLAAKVDELERKHADLENLLSVTDLPTICLDTDLAVRWFTPAAEKVIRLKAADRGRPLADVTHDFRNGGLVEVAQRVLNRLTPVEDEVSCEDGRVFIRRVLPYRTDDHRIGGVVMTFVDITERKAAERVLLESEQRLRRMTNIQGVAVLVFDAAGTLVDANDSFLQTFGYSREEVASRMLTWRALTPPEYVVLSEQQLEKLDQTGRLGPYEKEYSHKDGSRSWMLLAGTGLGDGTIIEYGIDVGGRRRAEAELRTLNATLEQQVSQRTDMLRMLQDITRAANEARSIEDAMLAAMERISRFNGWQVGHVWRKADDDSGEFAASNIWHISEKAHEAVGQLGEFRKLCARKRFSPGEILIGAVAQSGQPRWIDDIVHSSDWRRGYAKAIGLHAAIAFPVTVNDDVVAVLEFFSDHPAKRDKRFLEIMPDIGIQLGHMVERKRLEKLVADATEAEQRRIASDIHDGLGQELTGLRYMAQTHAESLAQQSSPDANTAARMARWLKTIQGQLRNIIRQLVPVEVDMHGLVAALRRLAEQTTEEHDLICSFECRKTISIGDATFATHIYRIAQEAVRNAVRHAQARHIRIQLTDADGTLRLGVVDDGVGIGPESDAGGGYGLRSMAYRAALIGGRLECRPAQDGGTAMICTVSRRLNSGD